ncbi:preprotein translocase subunit YajC [Brachybacterium sp. EF45031]|uniref:preprotein translocase subunit YajC n=1 Tax=Brachybacterium sillae TaxID=2810536 RepID=UPI00217D35F0|nr:preprotein translocase subunit YajC [Brachybacterium sillae]MCS6712723.1 preprotein translocase subunit YajC [Brachybacterium sillae]
MDLLPLILLFLVFMLPMLWLSSRQRKVQREQLAMLAALEVGDEVRTHSGFYGLVTELYDDVVILETESGAQTKWARQAIAFKVDPTTATGTLAGDQPEPVGDASVPQTSVDRRGDDLQADRPLDDPRDPRAER